ncbi:hypothetical protein [Paucibacter sp. DJ2R-2]|uniref:hypothetical protein n=1 Tax=Paucibacter sp. DJ2R-2 TaxID=2893558 RepID=UPI0021E4F40F|nr:hypothetical protein [Paucibacter sp. DJ2R-2]MCV2422532.1 hypothetical protein [Paucibacter sp. DJ4R-1]MCV2438730.1 hypothetical protein [Paucibacter sp. DJ2R-2]
MLALLGGAFSLRSEPLARFAQIESNGKTLCSTKQDVNEENQQHPCKKTNSVETTSRNSCHNGEKKDFYCYIHTSKVVL